MNCTTCGHANRERAKFCAGCGRALPLVCAACNAVLPIDARFCDACGQPVHATDPTPAPSASLAYTPRHLAAKILTSRSAIEGERKLVTVLFADVAGSTALAERLDPEEMHDIIDRCFRLLVEPVHYYEGTVNQFTGDGIMALFGAPIAHEDAPERAVRAGLEMQAAVRQFAATLEHRGIDFQIRIGIHTGPVVVGAIGDDLRMDYTAIGDTTNLSARLQTAARPGTVLVSEKTAKLIAGRFTLQPVGPLTLKGKSAPVAAYEVIRALPRAPLVAASSEGLTPLIGRTGELATLEALFKRASDAHGQVVFVVGDPGIGKSRLMHELHERIASDDVTWLQGRCISYGRGIPLLPIIDMVKNAFAIDEGDDDATIIDKIDRNVTGLSLPVTETAPFLRALLAVDPGNDSVGTMDPSARRFATFDVVKRLLLALVAQRPVALLIEDLHWIDAASEEFLAYIVDALAAARVLLLCTHRPGYRPALAERSYVTRVALQPLSVDETAALAAATLAVESLPPDVRTLISRKAEGNPFFIEEVTKSLSELGALRRSADGTLIAENVATAEIPNTIQDVIMARIDRLGDEPKRAIQVASVIGREFAVRLLQRASEIGAGVNSLVGELRALELIYEKLGVPELAYMFKHALTHDVAYHSILTQRRRQLHRTVGHAIEELYADRLAEHWETLAHHFANGEDWPRAFAYLLKAGEKARAAYANREAIQFYTDALGAAAHLDIAPSERAAVLKGKALAHLCLSQFNDAVDTCRAALALELDPSERAGMSTLLGLALWYAHEFDEATRVAEEARELALSAGNDGVVGQAQCVIASVRLVRGELDTVYPAMRESLQLMDSGGVHELFRPWARSTVALMQNWRGEYDAAVEGFARLVAETKASNQLFSLAQIYSHYVITLGGAGRYAEALAILREALAMAEAIGELFWRARLWNTRGWILGELGGFEAADESNQRCMEIAHTIASLRMTPELVGNAACNLADVALVRDDSAGVASHLGVVEAIVRDPRNEWMTWRYRMHYQLSAAEFALSRGEVTRAGELIARCRHAAQRTRSRRYLVRAARLSGLCHAADGDVQGADQILATAVQQARELKNPPQLWHTLLAHGRVQQRLVMREEALASWREALALVRSVEASVPDDMRGVLHSSPVSVALHELV